MSGDIRLEKIIAEQLGISEEEITPNARFVEDLGADSLDIMELVMAVEEECDIDIPEEEAEKIESVQDLQAYIGARYQTN